MIIYIGRDDLPEHRGSFHQRHSPSEHWNKHAKTTQMKPHEKACAREGEKKVKLSLL